MDGIGWLHQSVSTQNCGTGTFRTVQEPVMSKRAALTLSLAIAFPLLAYANQVSFRNAGGTISASGNSLSLTGSMLIGLAGFNGAGFTGNLGSLSLTTGTLLSGSLAAGGTFAAGGSFIAVSNGSGGLPGGVLFQGTFTSPVTWTAIWNPAGGPRHSGNWTYKLSGVVTGTFSTGQKVSAQFVAYTFDVPNGAQFSSSVRFDHGVAALVAPEPATMGLLGTGLVGLAAVGLRKRRKRV